MEVMWSNWLGLWWKWMKDVGVLAGIIVWGGRDGINSLVGFGPSEVTL